MQAHWQGRERAAARACALLVALGGLAACVAQPGNLGYGVAPGPVATLPVPAGRRVAILVPLSGNNAELGRSLLRAARLALLAGEGTAFDERDTHGTPEGAAAAAKAVIAGGAGIVVGPLTAAETGAVANVTRPLNIPVLAFTSDETRAQPEVWPMGITPAEQVRTLVFAARSDGKRQLGALLPRNSFGDALASGAIDAARQAGLQPPLVVRYRPGAALDDAIRELAGQSRETVDMLLLGSPLDQALGALPALTRAGLGPDRVRLLGTGIWSKDAPRAAALAGAWFAAPDPETLRLFEQNYMASYGTPPRDVASVAFDAAGVARAVTGPNGVNATMLLTPSGFSGPDGTFVLLPDGHVRRALATFEIGPSGVRRRQIGPEQPGPAGMM